MEYDKPPFAKEGAVIPPIIGQTSPMPTRYLVLLLLACLVSWLEDVCAQEPPNVEEVVLANPEEHLLGDLGRGELEENGVRIEAFNMSDFWVNAKGGHNRGGGVIGNMNLILTVDTEKMGLWDHGSFVFWGIGIYGRESSLSVGDYQFSSSIDAPPGLDPYEMYYQHTFLDGALDVLAGIHDFTLEFAVLNYAYTLINSSFTTPSTITQMPYSFYPSTGPGTRASAKLTERLYLLVGAYDGDTANFTNPTHQTWAISKQGGVYSISEIGWIEDDPKYYHTKVALGGWYNSGTIVDYYGEDATGNYGTYLLAEQEVWREHQDDPEQGLGLFAQLGQADNDVNINPWYFGAGLHYQGVIPDRDEDVLAFGYAHAQMSSRYQEYIGTTEESEKVWEVSYRARVTKSITLTPDVQYIVDPYVNPDLSNALVFYLRTEVAL
jgi:porin